jgi:general secretion pathway protein G
MSAARRALLALALLAACNRPATQIVLRVDSDLAAIGIALQSYESRALRRPTTEQGLIALVEKPTTEPIPERWRSFMEEVPKDPWGQPYKYREPAVSSKKPYDVYSVGADGQDGTQDDIGNWKAVAPK